MITDNDILIFKLDDLTYGVVLSVVVRVVHAVEIRILPGAPEIISGIINVQGTVIPVVNIRKRFGIQERDIEPDDRIIIAYTGRRHIAVLADSVSEVRSLHPDQIKPAQESLSYVENLKGVAKIDNELILIYDLEKFIDLDEEKQLEKALTGNIDED